jgi:hypothetical protein
VILPETFGNSDEDVSLNEPGALGQAVCEHRSSLVAGRGMPLKLTVYVAVPPVRSDFRSYATHRSVWSPGDGFSGLNPKLVIVA